MHRIFALGFVLSVVVACRGEFYPTTDDTDTSASVAMPERVSTVVRPARAPPVMSVSSRSPITAVVSGLASIRRSASRNIQGSGLPVTKGSTPVAVSRAANSAPVPALSEPA